MSGEEGLLDPSDIDAIVGATNVAQEPSLRGPDEKGETANVGLREFDAQPYQLDEIATSQLAGTGARDVSLILDVDLNVRVELGRTRMYIEDLLKLREGSIVPLEKLAGDPVDIFVNGRLMGRGEVLVLNDNFCVRISEVFGEQPDSTAD